jgi:hypothetical protein
MILQTVILSVVIVAIGMILLLVKVILKKNGEFASQHIHDSEAMRERGIHCVIDQDREERNKAKLKQ